MPADKVNIREVITVLRERLPEDATRNALQHKLDELNKEHFTEEAKEVSFRRYYAFAAAAAIIVFAIILWPQRDYVDQFGTIEMITSSERGNNADSLLQQASVFFNNKEYDEALPLLEKAVKADSTSQMALFYRGVAKLYAEGEEQSRKDLEKVFNGESVFREEAAFYIGLGYAEEDNTAAAKEWLRKVPENSPAGNKAKKLLRKL